MEMDLETRRGIISTINVMKIEFRLDSRIQE